MGFTFTSQLDANRALVAQQGVPLAEWLLEHQAGLEYRLNGHTISGPGFGRTCDYCRRQYRKPPKTCEGCGAPMEGK